MPLEIREAQLSDAPAMAKLSLALGYDGDETVMYRRLERLLGRSDHVVFVAVERPHGVIGFAQASVQVSILIRPHADIGSLIVASNQRHAGVGRQLLERVHGWALRRGIDDMVTRFQSHRKEAHAFYGSLGYKVTKELRLYARDLGSPDDLPESEQTKMD